MVIISNVMDWNYYDALNRLAVQTQQTGVIWNGGRNTRVSLISGRAVTDAFGRTVATHYPTTAARATCRPGQPTTRTTAP